MPRNKRTHITAALPRRRATGRAKRAAHTAQLPVSTHLGVAFPPRVQRLIAVLAQIEANPAPAAAPAHAPAVTEPELQPEPA